MQELTYEDYFLHDLDFAIEYISLHYPFSETQIRLYMQHLKKGDAYYPIYENRSNNFKVPELGLCYNANISWNDELKAEWQMNTADGSIPLSIATFVDKYHQYAWEWDLSNHEYTEHELLNMEHDHVPHEILHPVTYPHLSPAELFNGCRNKQEILYNESIWENTLKDVLTADMVELLIHAKKQRMEQETAKEPLHVVFPDFHEFMAQMPPDHDKDPCFGAFNLYESLFAGRDINAAIDGYARKWETSHKKILQHMDCVHEFLNEKHPNVLRCIEAHESTNATEDGLDDDEGDYFEDDENEDFSDDRNRKYNGYNGWPDDAIDEAFEGDPEATWNVD